MKQCILLLFTAVFFMACDDEIKTEKDMNRYVNRWIHDNMSAVYYWTDDLPAYKRSYDDPSGYFNSLLSNNDRFSSIHESYQDILNQLNGVRYTDVGFDFQLYRESRDNNNIFGVVLYLKPGTQAETLGVKRGDIFNKINGSQINLSNYGNLINHFYNANADVSVTFADYVNGILTDKKTVSILKASNYTENPVLMDSVYKILQKRIGYVVYNFFAADPGDDTKSYDLKLNSLMTKFNQENISDLVVDLRYNSGGAMSSAVHLASMLVPGLKSDMVFSNTSYNRNYTQYFNSSEFKKKYDFNPFVSNFETNIEVKTTSTQTHPIQNVGNKLQKIYFLTGPGTASASEMVINGLKPYINCVMIGDTTVGKNVGSTLINDEDNKQNNWAIMPIILEYSNKDKQSDFANGFAPDFRVIDNYAYPLGDIRDALLAKALEQITGIQQGNEGISKTPAIKTGVSPIHLEFMQRGLWVERPKIP